MIADKQLDDKVGHEVYNLIVDQSHVTSNIANTVGEQLNINRQKCTKTC